MCEMNWESFNTCVHWPACKCQNVKQHTHKCGWLCECTGMCVYKLGHLSVSYSKWGMVCVSLVDSESVTESEGMACKAMEWTP